MTLPLRQRRRHETALQIQRATLELGTENGLDHVTTEEIAVAAGVSTRTFFNYFPNKEAAAIGHPPEFCDTDLVALRDSTAPLAEDIKRLLDEHLNKLAEDEAILRMVGNVLRDNEKARGILDGFLLAQRKELAEVLCHRMANSQAADALAFITTSAIGCAISLWEHENNITLSTALDRVWEGFMDASKLLSQRGE